jgi:hypothetical protein
MAMQLYEIDNIESLRKTMRSFGADFLFRGQSEHYVLADGSPSLVSSFARMGCVPPLMLKWVFYTNELLRRSGIPEEKRTLSIEHAILQHYGWRSFFVDLTASQEVAAWFASHKFFEKPSLYLCEDAFEEPVFLKHNATNYEENTDLGHVYVLEKQTLLELGHELVDLNGELPSDEITRFKIQKAWMARNTLDVVSGLDSAAIRAYIKGPSKLFKQFAAEAGFSATASIFPSSKDDAIFSNMLNLPWISFGEGIVGMSAYHRSLEIPDYEAIFVKHLPTETTLYSSFWLNEVKAPFIANLYMRVPDMVFYGSAKTGLPIPNIKKYLSKYGSLVIETKDLVCYPTSATPEYEKGIFVKQQGELVLIQAISVAYCSSQRSSLGLLMGYHYKWDADNLVRECIKEDCGCGDSIRHDYHIRALAVLDSLLEDAKINELSSSVVEVDFKT